MIVEITKKVEVRETVDIEFPYYFRHDLSNDLSDSVIFGKIEERCITTIHITTQSDVTSVEVERSDQYFKYSSCYFDPQYKSSATAYAEAKIQAMRILDKA